MNKTDNKYLYWLTFVAINGGLLFGLNMAGIAGANSLIKDEFSLTDSGLGTVAALLTIGCLAGALFTGFFAEKYGRKMVLTATAVLYIIAALGCASANSSAVLILFRVLSGLAVGASSVVVPMYISEIAPAAKRGMFVSFNQLAITIGVLLAYVFDYLLIGLGNDSWRYMLAVPAVFSLFFLICLLADFTESPRWLLLSGQRDKAAEVLKKLGKVEDTEDVDEMKNTRNLPKKASLSVRSLFKGKNRKVLLIGCTLAILQQVTGINAVIMFAPDIFQSAGSLQDDALLQSMIVGFINFTMTVIALRFVDSIGRKKLLLWGAIGMILSLGYLTYAFLDPHPDPTRVLIALLAYISFFAASFAPVVWVVISEIYPDRIKGPGMSIATATVWLSAFITVKFTPVIYSSLGTSYVFGIFCLFSFLSVIFVKFCVPETKGKSLEQIEREF